MVNFVGIIAFKRILVAAIVFSAPPVVAADGWSVSNKDSGFTHNTQTGMSSHKGIRAKGLVSVKKVSGRTLKVFWEPGAASQSMELDGKIISPGPFQNNAARKSSVRLSPQGSVVHIQSAKGPNTKVWLVQDGKKIRNWKRGAKLSIVRFDGAGVVIAERISKTNSVHLYRYGLDELGQIDPERSQKIGSAKGCTFVSAIPYNDTYAAELLCQNDFGRGIYQFNSSADPQMIVDEKHDETLAHSLLRRVGGKKQKGRLGVLSAHGSADGLHFYHAINGLLLRELGEPTALASDESGKQSWAQSYRTMALAEIYKKTGHGIFAQLASRAMENVLDARNGALGLSDLRNPDCGWASRIYSEDKKTPISFMINQAVITGALINACKFLEEQCATTLRAEIAKTSICISRAIEKQYDEPSRLYRIKKGVPFRFDGIWAPWNWQLSMAPVLRHAGEQSGNKKWVRRAHSLTDSFLKTVEYRAEGALWKYWPSQYYQGWNALDGVSVNRPKFKPKANERYEDINHAGISLLGLCDFDPPASFLSSTRNRLEFLINGGGNLARDMDGRGPVTARWQPTAGWDCLGSDTLKNRMTKNLPTARFGATLLSYARHFDADATFDLRLRLKSCDVSGCKTVRNWRFSSAADYLQNSPHFTIVRNDTLTNSH